MTRGSLRIYLGAAPGVGKTFAMLGEGRRRAERGTDVVVGYLETHGRSRTAAQLGELAVIGRRRILHEGVEREEMDVDAILARRPQVALVDELAHSNAPGSRHAKRWEDVDDLLEAGIDVISTLNISHLESLSDVCEAITGVAQRELVPDAVVRAADQIELVDMTPEALRRRLAHGNVYEPETLDVALANYFRVGNLAALRELSLLWVADRVDEALQRYRAVHGVHRPWETRERVVVALTGAPGGEALIRRAARMAARAKGDLIGVHVEAEDGLAAPPIDRLARHRELLEEFGGTYHEIRSSDVAGALVGLARTENATQLVLGATMRSRLSELMRGSVINEVIRQSGPIDVHVVSREEAPAGPRLPRMPAPAGRRRPSPLPRRRRQAAWALALAGAPLQGAAMVPLRQHLQLSSVLLLFLLQVVAAAALGGAGPALAAATVGFLLANWYFTPPLHRWTIAEPQSLIALLVYLVVAGVVSWFVATVARRSAEVARARAEAETLARVAAASADEDPLGPLARQLLVAFEQEAVAVLRRGPDDGGGPGGPWTVEAGAGSPVPAAPAEATETLPLGEDTVLALVGPRLPAEDRHLLSAFTAGLGAALTRRRLQEGAAEAARLARADELRAALLAAVSHDLRTPLASIKACVSSLLQDDVDWSEEAVAEFLSTIDEETDRLSGLVANLLDMSRLQAGALTLHRRPVGVEEIVPAALSSLGDRARGDVVEVGVAETLPRVDADPALLERVLANLIDNALAWSPPGVPVRVEAGGVPGAVHVRIVDRGPGIPPAERDRVFLPFQRLGDRSSGAGVGLGLAVARGFTVAMGGELTVEDTPGGGTTMVVVLPTSPGPDVAADPPLVRA
ncbi:MAG TPA: ATP-binding protein [Acidimicrobiia bacterium]|nr:ATP-binding protein [Acidimicrobiia bacterium]